MRRPNFNLKLLRWEVQLLIWEKSCDRLWKDVEEHRCTLPPCHSFWLTGIRAYFSMTLMHNEDQLIHLAFWIQQLLDSWTFHWETAIVGLSRTQPVGYSKISPFKKKIHSIIAFSLEKCTRAKLCLSEYNDKYLHAVGNYSGLVKLFVGSPSKSLTLLALIKHNFFNQYSGKRRGWNHFKIKRNRISTIRNVREVTFVNFNNVAERIWRTKPIYMITWKWGFLWNHIPS